MNPHRIGQVTIVPVVECSGVAVEADWLLAGATREAIAAEAHWMGPRAIEASTGRLAFDIQSLVVRTAQHTMLVDTCCGNGRFRGEGSPFHMLDTAYLERLEAAGVDPDSVDFVMCTHLHADHVGWNMRQDGGRWRPTFPNARYVIARDELAFWRDAMPRGFGSVGTRAAYTECVAPLVADGRALPLAPGDRLGHALDDVLGIEELGGHTPGHIGLHVRSEGAHALLTGDVLHHPVQCAHPEWGSPADVDPARALATRQRLIDTYADSSTLIVPAHFAAGHLVGHGSAARFRFASAELDRA